jgi:type IV secretion system protein VirD4
MTGVKTVQKATFNFSGSRLSPIMGHVNASVDHIERPLMTPDEILRLRPALKEGRGESEEIVAPGQMLIFVSGHYPILGTQMLYFSDPVLSKRAKISPPTDFYSLEPGRIQPQPPIDRAPNVISRPETVGDTCDGIYESPMEKGLVQELELTGIPHRVDRER